MVMGINMTANGRRAVEMERDFSRKLKLEELKKENTQIKINSSKSLKSFRMAIELHL